MTTLSFCLCVYIYILFQPLEAFTHLTMTVLQDHICAPPVIQQSVTASSTSTLQSMASSSGNRTTAARLTNTSPIPTSLGYAANMAHSTPSPNLTMPEAPLSLQMATNSDLADTSTATLDHMAVSAYLPLVVGEGIVSAEQLLQWKRICADALVGRLFSGPSVNIQGSSMESAADCLSQYLIHLHTPEATTPFVAPLETTCTMASRHGFLHDSRVYRV